MAATVFNSRLTSTKEKNSNTCNLDNAYSSRSGQNQRIRQYQSGSADVSAAVPRSIPEYVLDAPVPGLRETLGDVKKKGDCTRKAEAPPTGQPQAQPHFLRRQPRRRANRLDHPGDDGDSDSDGEDNLKKNYDGDAERMYNQNPYQVMNERAFAQNMTQVVQPPNLHNGQGTR